jgi:hypothetical protein
MSERPRLTQISGSVESMNHVYTIAGATDGNENQFVNKTGATVNITGATVVFDTDVTSNDTANFAIQLINKGLLGVGTTAVTSKVTFNTTRGDLAKFVPLALTLSTTAANLLVAAGEVVTLDKTHNGTGGLALPNGKLALQFQFV